MAFSLASKERDNLGPVGRGDVHVVHLVEWRKDGRLLLSADGGAGPSGLTLSSERSRHGTSVASGWAGLEEPLVGPFGGSEAGGASLTNSPGAPGAGLTGATVHGGYLLSPDGQTVTFYSVTEAYSGIFTCSASNTHGRDTKEFRVNVKSEYNRRSVVPA
ncbi:unnamed protein product [Protopolystoma xenopodis]|uniref:Ig-like domain-containing protein n=1 Tax=Protopolystoma xenopodis TaxID=117903 RepID=A0A3S5C910_9PLAT|nr:unnamed protein product [Protopolystoma xenopodis]